MRQFDETVLRETGCGTFFWVWEEGDESVPKSLNPVVAG